MTSTKQIFSPPQIGYPSMDERERREINNTTMGYEEVRDNKDTKQITGADGLGAGRDACRRPVHHKGTSRGSALCASCPRA